MWQFFKEQEETHRLASQLQSKSEIFQFPTLRLGVYVCVCIYIQEKFRGMHISGVCWFRLFQYILFFRQKNGYFSMFLA